MENRIKPIQRVQFKPIEKQNNNKNNNKNNNIAQILKQYSETKQIEITNVDLLNLFVKYRIPIAKETIEYINKFKSFIIKK